MLGRVKVFFWDGDGWLALGGDGHHLDLGSSCSDSGSLSGSRFCLGEGGQRALHGLGRRAGFISGWSGFDFGSVGFLPFVDFGVGFLEGLLLAGVWVSGMLLHLDAVGLLLTGLQFRGGLCFWRAGGGAFA
ncbi:hypothetical protein XENOCAPTIV_004342 [Xenoophorus captivus]|uniref:Uncharacterized protein n=1 Tax=Xenoophorus captivus TaxID=1517983 RepID=A0ABV0SE08_9TELE